MEHAKLNYVEFPAKNLTATKQFFESVFSWTFIDYGSEYSAFSNAGLEGGFYFSELESRCENGGALLVFYSNNITDTQAKVEKAGGIINKNIFEFPGGCRFHFIEPSGNEFAVWSETAE